MSYSKAILGDNQFLGVNHANQKKATQLFDRFANPDAVLEVLADAYAAGLRDFMFTTHDRYEPVFEEICRSNLFPGMHYTPCLPYAHKYWNQLSEKGLLGLISSTVLQVNPLGVIPAVLGLSLGKPKRIIRLLTEIEILMCKGLPIRGIFLQNLAFDFLLSLELYGVIEDFAQTVTSRFNVHPGFITMNHPKSVEVLCDKIGLHQPWVCANYNEAGFRMNPSQNLCEASFAAKKTKNIAMSVFSSGMCSSPSEALRYTVSRMENGGVDSILFGSSSKVNIIENRSIING